MIRTIREIGDPVLLQMARDVTLEELHTPEIQTLIEDMIRTLKTTTGVGLAAPQVGESLRICIIDKPLTVLVNPVITLIGETTDSSWEGCLSVPGMRGEVVRHQNVRVQAIDRNGKKIDALWTKFRAIVVQHEVDHLDGILYVSRARDELIPDPNVAPKHVEQALPDTSKVKGRKTFVVDSEKPMGGKQFVTFTFEHRGRMTGLRLQPGGALVTGVWLSGVRLRRAGYKAGVAEETIVGMEGLHLAAGDQLRIELQILKGKRRIVAEVDVDLT